MPFREIENLMLLKESADKTRMFWTLLEAQGLSYFEHHLKSRLEAEKSELPDDFIQLALRKLYLGLEYIPKLSINVKKYDLRQPRALYMGLNKYVQQLVKTMKVNNLNRYFLYFPKEHSKPLDQDEIIKIMNQAKSWDPEWYEAMVNAKIDILEMNHEESLSFFKILESLEKIRRTKGLSPATNPVGDKKSDTVISSVDRLSENPKSSKMWCHYCEKNNHNMTDSRAIAKSKQ
jgi:hypothetical protein